VSLSDFTAIGGSDVEGRLAVFGNVAISNYSVSFVVPPPASYVDWFGHVVTDRHDLLVCGKLTFLSGAVMGGGNAIYVDQTSDIRAPIASVQQPGQFLRHPACPLAFGDVSARLYQLSDGLASLPRTGTAQVEYT